MALKKSICSYKKPDGTWEPGKDIDMHPLEEAEIRAFWAIHDAQIKIPEKPSQQQEHDWLIDFGPEYVKQKRAEWQTQYDALIGGVLEAEKYHQECTKAWHEHVELCVAHKCDPNTFEGDAREKLRMP